MIMFIFNGQKYLTDLFYSLKVYWMYMSVLPECVCVHHINACCLRKSEEKASDPLELKLQTARSHHVGSGTGS